uniref:RNase H type-1 domain-containing protein n=1 Tax=Cajanus cajan TaxID=3821 RepID=A0A151QV89_CAJCA|nr:hypothetical protein KK1_044915 [Cajanus cajan]
MVETFRQTSVKIYPKTKEFNILKAFLLPCRLRKVISIVEVRWILPPPGWIKCNTDGAFSAYTSSATCGIIFRDSSTNMIGCLVELVVAKSVLEVEVLAIIHAIHIAHDHGWMFLWLEFDSLLVIKAFYSPFLVPWCLSF